MSHFPTGAHWRDSTIVSDHRCIFCKSINGPFKAEEHIVPESLGNTDHCLPRGIVCDRCNNYFAIKIEQPILDNEFFRQARFRRGIANKRRRIPRIDGLTLLDAVHLQLSRSQNGELLVEGVNDRASHEFAELLSNRERFTLLVPFPQFPDGRLVARFLAVIALRAFAHRLLVGGVDIDADLIDKQELLPILRFARYNDGPDWDYSKRRIYPEDHSFCDEGGLAFEVLHEFMFLYTKARELYFVIAILGIEFAINMGGPEIGGYDVWLGQHSYRSPLLGSAAL
jgi:HNH endonuclease